MYKTFWMLDRVNVFDNICQDIIEINKKIATNYAVYLDISNAKIKFLYILSTTSLKTFCYCSGDFYRFNTIYGLY